MVDNKCVLLLTEYLFVREAANESVGLRHGSLSYQGETRTCRFGNIFHLSGTALTSWK